MKIVFRDERNELSDGTFKEEIYLYQGGIKEYAQYMNAEKDSIHPEIIKLTTERKRLCRSSFAMVFRCVIQIIFRFRK